MNFRYLLIVILVLGFISVGQARFTKKPSFDVALISEQLTENANAVVRFENRDFTISSEKSATLKVHRVVTILNKEGEGFALFYIHYDPQRKVRDAECYIYNAQGQQVKKIKSRDMYDRSAVGAGTLYDDSRVMFYEHQTNQYPYTIEYTYEIEFKGLFFYPGWHPVRGEKLSVERSSFNVHFPQNLQFRHKTFLLPEEPKVSSTEKGTTSYNWNIRNFAAIEKEPRSPDFSELTPAVLLAPNSFEYEGYAGNLESWQSFGQWINKLNRGRDLLPEKSVQEVQAMLKGIEDPREKVKKIYEYMQGHTRYVGIQLGIGGYQPFDATTVVETGYGDCKALTNYTQALLKVAGIPSYYTLVNAGNDADPVYADFSSTQFNHAFLCVPLQEDTVWLECTSQDNPFDYLGYFTSDRNVLVVDESGGKIVRTRKYTAEENLQHRTAVVQLTEDGNGSATIQTRYEGLQYAHVDHLLRYPQAEQEKMLSRQIDIPNFTLLNYQLQDDKDVPLIDETLEVSLQKYGQSSSKRLFFRLNLMNHHPGIPSGSGERKSDVVLDMSYLDTDTIVYLLPENMHPEFLPEDVQLSSAFGEYSASMEVKQGKLVYIRRLKVEKGRFPASSFDEIRNFYQKVSQADQVKVVLAKST